MWPDGSKSVQIEANLDSFRKTAYEITNSDVRSRAEPTYKHSLDNNGQATGVHYVYLALKVGKRRRGHRFHSSLEHDK